MGAFALAAGLNPKEYHVATGCSTERRPVAQKCRSLAFEWPGGLRPTQAAFPGWLPQTELLGRALSFCVLCCPSATPLFPPLRWAICGSWKLQQSALNVFHISSASSLQIPATESACMKGEGQVGGEWEAQNAASPSPPFHPKVLPTWGKKRRKLQAARSGTI